MHIVWIEVRCSTTKVTSYLMIVVHTSMMYVELLILYRSYHLQHCDAISITKYISTRN